MRTIKNKDAVALNLSVVDEGYVYNAIEQAKGISKEFEMKVCLTNPFNGEFAIFDSDSDTKEVFLKLKQL